MLNNINKTDLFYDYYAQWITVYKEGAIRKVTMDKYLLTLSWIKRLAPELKVCELSRIHGTGCQDLRRGNPAWRREHPNGEIRDTYLTG